MTHERYVEDLHQHLSTRTALPYGSPAEDAQGLTPAREALSIPGLVHGPGTRANQAPAQRTDRSSSAALVKLPRRMRLLVMPRKKRSTLFSQDALVRVKCLTLTHFREHRGGLDGGFGATNSAPRMSLMGRE